MQYRKFSAAQIFNGFQFEAPGKVLVTDKDGKIEGIIPREEAGNDVEELEGIITPGLINCHCHLELSHMKNLVPPRTGLIDFLCTVVQKRGFEETIVRQAIANAEQEMYDHGIVAVGDISNTADTIGVKSKSRIRWQNFIEVLSLADQHSTERISHYTDIVQQFNAAIPYPSRTVLSPHAPYTISPATFHLLNEATANQVITIHNQECAAEDELYITGNGAFISLYNIFGMQQSPLPVSGKSSLQTYLPFFNRNQTIILVHNTFINEADILFAKDYAQKNNLSIVYCLCPNANLYIENRLPPVDLLLKHQCQLVLGTDSYSSNWQLSIAAEIKTILPATSIDKTEQKVMALQWATSNAARALQWDDLGRFEVGLTPGIVLVADDFENAVRLL